MYDNVRDAQSYLNGTVAFWDGAPIYIERIEADFGVSGYKLPVDGRAVRETFGTINDKRFQCQQYRLGYLNWSTGAALYVSRRPHRGVHQGLSDQNLSIIDGLGNPQSMARAIREQGFADMLMGKYPTPAEAAKMMDKKGTTSVAFDRYLAVSRHPHFENLRFLKYKGRDVSWSDKNEFKLPEEFKYLQQICEPTGIIEKAA